MKVHSHRCARCAKGSDALTHRALRNFPAGSLWKRWWKLAWRRWRQCAECWRGPGTAETLRSGVKGSNVAAMAGLPLLQLQSLGAAGSRSPFFLRAPRNCWRRQPQIFQRGRDPRQFRIRINTDPKTSGRLLWTENLPAANVVLDAIFGTASARAVPVAVVAKAISELLAVHAIQLAAWPDLDSRRITPSECRLSDVNLGRPPGCYASNNNR